MAEQIIPQSGPETEIQDGATAFQMLFKAIESLSNETVLQFDESGEYDSRDYVQMVSMVSESINRNIIYATAGQREGYMRALTDLLCMAADGTSPGPNWNPFENTAAAFNAWESACEVIHG